MKVLIAGFSNVFTFENLKEFHEMVLSSSIALWTDIYGPAEMPPCRYPLPKNILSGRQVEIWGVAQKPHPIV